MHVVVAIGITAVAIGIVPTRDATYWTADAAAVDAAAIPDDVTVEALVAIPASATPAPPPTGPGMNVTEPATTVAVAETDAPLVTSKGAREGDGDTAAANASVPATNSSLLAHDTIIVAPLPTLSRPARIVVVGDSTAQAAGAGLVQWAADNPTVAKVAVVAIAGCGFVRGGVVATDGAATFVADCAEVLDVRLPEVLATLHPNVVMLMTTIRDVEPRIFDDAEGALTPVDHAYLTRAFPDYLAIENLILDNSIAHVAWIRPPATHPYWINGVQPSMDPDAHAAIEHVMVTAAAAHPDRVAVIDLGAWFEQ